LSSGHKIKEQDILNEEWDTLVILDACRYDYFKQYYRDYLDGKLEARWSRGSDTTSWLVNTFTERIDATYISANPRINSKGFPLSKFFKEPLDWKATDYFTEIIDVWDTHWDNRLGTVLPQHVTKVALANRNDRLIVHYIQPHEPYLLGTPPPNPVKKDLTGHPVGKILLVPLVYTFLPKVVLNASKFGVKRLAVMERIYLKYGIERLRQLYTANLRIVLGYVSKLVEKLNGKIIITADHGELLEDNKIGHPKNSDEFELRTVPWLVIENG